MATMTVQCVDAATINYPYNTSTQYTKVISEEDAFVIANNMKYYIGYRKSEYTAAANTTSEYISNGALGAPALFLFKETDLSFLTNSSIISAKLVLTPATNRPYDQYPVYGELLNIRPEIKLSTIPGDYQILTNSVSTSSRFFSYSEDINANISIEIDLSNNLSTIINLVNNGLMIYVGRGGPRAKNIVFFNNTALQQFQPYIEIEYLSDDTPPTVSPLSPVSDVVNGDKPITFTWSYSQDVNEPQSHYSIQQQTSSGWQNLIPKTAGTAHTATVPAGTFTAGQAAWRVMVWSQNGTVASQWSDPAYIIVQSQPKAPNITSAGTSPSPTFAWQAAQQQGYEIILGDYQAGVKYGTEKTWTYPGTLQNGNVTFQIRVQNAQGIWSPWAGVETYISNIPQGTVSLSGNVKDQAVSLAWTSSGMTASQYNVLRDGKVIATTQNTVFTDYYSAGKCAYQVYAMLSGGYYTPSNVLTEIVKPKYAMISLASSISWIPLRIKSGGLPTYGSEMQTQAAFVHYQGRELPVAYTTGFLDKSYTYSFSFLRKEDMQVFAKLCGQMVILKTPQGERSIGILTGISATRQNRINDFSFSITEIDFSEVELNA